MGGACRTHRGKGGEVLIGFWWGNVKKRDDLEDPRVGGRIILRWNFRKWTGSMWLRRGTVGGHL